MDRVVEEPREIASARTLGIVPPLLLRLSRLGPALAEALAAILLDPEKARAMAERGRRAVAEKFDARRTARDVVAVFEQTIARV